MNVNFEQIIRGLKSDVFLSVKSVSYICRIQLQKKKSRVNKWMEISAILGGVDV